MNEPTFNYHDEAFGLDAATDCTLLVQLHGNGFSYAITANDKLLVCESNHPLQELSAPEELADIFEADYKQLVVGLPATGFSLIPVQVYDAANANGYARLLNVQPTESVFVQQLDSENFIIYKADTKLADLAKTRFGLAYTVFNAKGWVKAIAANQPADDTIYINLLDNRIELLYLRYDKIRYYNSFECNSDSDAVYFAALAAKAINMETADVRLSVSGAVEAGDELISTAAPYFKAVELNNISLVQLPLDIEQQQVLSLVALSLCAL
ncbi:DUF3822 family protein [Mucilaginibacter sp. UR6-1]|uniref:DUF3822 family protein n=1 Tax=Mucilaginibacter sp. UR6-1 TaxID=1435643 RepID=UPI001E496B73|nr:DUF3822 family protein [Mucilaginibacter sp. UR6-1]MCC8408295.1 DUF3822 family protein [Mucilaginibacter sp. UR6-1]